MSTQHKALELADWLEGMVCIYPQQSEDEPGGYATEYDQKVDEAVLKIRAQHALIVQMQEALRECLNCEFAVTDKAALSKAISTIAAADKYLGEQE